jgi:hypothetical protein
MQLRGQQSRPAPRHNEGQNRETRKAPNQSAPNPSHAHSAHCATIAPRKVSQSATHLIKQAGNTGVSERNTHPNLPNPAHVARAARSTQLGFASGPTASGTLCRTQRL